MHDAFAHAGSWLLQAAATLPDTIVMRQVAPQRSWFEQVASVAATLMSITLVALAIAVVPAAWNFRKSYKKLNDLLERIYGDVNPLMRHASSIADNVNYITTSIRTDVQQVNATIATANQRLQDAVAMTESRLRDFNALLAVVQEEAEGAFVSTAATVRGVRQGAATFRGNGHARPEFAEVESGLGGDDDEADELYEEETDDGDNSDTDTLAHERGRALADERQPGPGTAGPRIRRRSR